MGQHSNNNILRIHKQKVVAIICTTFVIHASSQNEFCPFTCMTLWLITIRLNCLFCLHLFTYKHKQADDLELSPRFYLGSNEQHRLFQASTHNVLVCAILVHPVHQRFLTIMAIQIHALTHSLRPAAMTTNSISSLQQLLLWQLCLKIIQCDIQPHLYVKQ